MVERALKAAEALAEEGIDAEVIDLRWINPIDYDTSGRASIDRSTRHRRGAVPRRRLGSDDRVAV
jgi:pyruvate/2-oxoglutarate/acetoin dehydrogenase E1 component